jgi:hypothetical protein
LKTETAKIKVHPNWIRFMFAVQIVVGGGLGFAILIGHQAAFTYFNFPTEELYIGGMVASVMVAYAIMSIIGMFFPMKIYPILLLQAIEKTTWLLALVVPQLVNGPLPGFVVMQIAIYIPLTIGDLIAVPWKHLFAK